MFGFKDRKDGLAWFFDELLWGPLEWLMDHPIFTTIISSVIGAIGGTVLGLWLVRLLLEQQL